MQQLLRLFFVLIFGISYSQNETNIWYFGRFAGLDFNSGSPVALTDGQMNTDEGCAVMSDANGNLMFYTGGVKVYNRNHDIMPNGGDLNGASSSTQSAVVIPRPGHPNIFYVFTVDETAGDNGLQYSEIDMSLDNGFGDVTTNKNILLETPTTEKITAVKNSITDSYWVVSHKFNSDEYMSFEVTEAGVNTTPVISAVGSYFGYLPPPVIMDPSGRAAGQLKISPDGTKIASATVVDNILELFDFNAETGQVSNQRILYSDPAVNSPEYCYGVEFSPNSKLLYMSEYEGNLYQFNLEAGTTQDIINSRVDYSEFWEEYGSLQLGPDGKIYIAKWNKFYIDVIHNPNELGLSSNYEEEAIYLGGQRSAQGLPAMIQSYFNIGIQAENVCEGELVEFATNISETYNSLLWDFGDGTTSTEENPSHLYSAPGDYNVNLEIVTSNETYNQSKTLTVYEVPIVTPIVELSQCDDDLDGFSSFNLNEAIGEITSNAANEDLTFYESQIDAENADNPIVNVTSYINETVSTDTIWVRVENSFGCYAISQVNLTVSTTQIPDTFTRNFYQCDSGANTTDGIATFDFSTVITDVEALFPVGQQLIINFYESVTDALSETNPITNASNYQNSNSPYIQQIYIRVDSALNNDCLGLGLHITLHVEAVPIVNAVTFPVACDVDGDGTFAFDTTTLENDLRNGQTDITISYTDENGTVLPSPLSNPFETSSQTITVRLTNANSQNPSGACYTESSIDFVVQDQAIAHPINDIMACDENGDGIFAFNTTDLEASLLNGQTGMIVSYFDENSNALSSPLPNPFNSSTQTITARVENALTANCFDETTINFIVSEQPVANTVMDHFVCNNLANNAQYTFNLSSYDNEVLAGQSNLIYEISYFNTQTDAETNQSPLPNFYEVNTDVVNVFARIQNRSNTECYDITSFQLGLSYLPIANQPNDLGVCDDSSNDGIENFNLDNQNENILNGLPEADYNITYHLNQSDAETSSMSLNVSYTNIENPQTVFARLENVSNPSCYTVTSFSLIVYETPVLVMEDEMAICDGSSVQLTADFGYDYYNWSTGQTTRTITVYEPGVYTVNVSNTYGDLVCSTEKTILVEESDSAVITEIATIDWSQNDNVIEVYVDGIGDYEYSIDNFNYQNSNVFSDLSVGEYTIYVRDKNGCGIVSEEVYLLYYPKYFTPNGDGVRDVWQVINAFEEPNNRLSIYDRYGKLIKTLKPNDFGWDGMYNGNKMPSSDYWFVLERENGKTYNGHFSLKR